MTLTDQAAEYAAEFNGAPAAVQGLMKRAFMFGALSARTDKASKLYTERQFAVICSQLVSHVGAMAELYAQEVAA